MPSCASSLPAKDKRAAPRTATTWAVRKPYRREAGSKKMDTGWEMDYRLN